MDRFINVGLLANPLNWVTLAVWLVALSILAYGLGLHSQEQPASSSMDNIT
jgi:hypothetical protein